MKPVSAPAKGPQSMATRIVPVDSMGSGSAIPFAAAAPRAMSRMTASGSSHTARAVSWLVSDAELAGLALLHRARTRAARRPAPPT